MVFKAHINNLDVVYGETFWTGKRELSFNGVSLKQVEKKLFSYEDKMFKMKGSLLTQVRLVNLDDENEVIQVLPKFKVWQFILVLLPVILVFGGFVGGIIGVTCWAFNCVYMRKHDELKYQILLPILCIIFWTAAFVGLEYLLNFLENL